MIKILFDDIKAYFDAKANPTEEEQQLKQRLSEGYFPITSVHRDDLQGAGFDMERISDDDMKELPTRWPMIIASNCFGKAWKSSPRYWVFRRKRTPSAPSVNRKTSDTTSMKTSSIATHVPKHGTTKYTCWSNFPKIPRLLRKPVTCRGTARTTGRFTCPKKSISATTVNPPPETSAIGPSVGRIPRNTWIQKVANSFRMKMHCKNSVLRPIGFRYH